MSQPPAQLKVAELLLAKPALSAQGKMMACKAGPKAAPAQPPSTKPRRVPKAASVVGSDGAAAGGPVAVPCVYSPGVLGAARRAFMLSVPHDSSIAEKTALRIAEEK